MARLYKDLPPAAAFSKTHPLTSFDANHNRIFQLSKIPNFNQELDFYDFKGFLKEIKLMKSHEIV